MKNYQKDKGGFRGDRGDRGGRPSFKPSFKSRDGDRGGDREMTMYKAVCSECKKSCDVPFRPTGDKPVYCRDCFADKRGVDERGPRPSSNAYEPKRFGNDRPATRVEAPRAEFKSQSNDETKKQLADISFKLDKLINAIEKLSVSKKEVIVPAVTEVKEKVATSTPIVKSVAKSTAASVTKKVAAPKAVKKVATKKVEAKKVVAKKVAPKKVIAKKTK